MPEPYFQGAECDWLRSQVAAMLWNPTATRQAGVSPSTPPARTSPYTPLAGKPTPLVTGGPKQAQDFARTMSVEEYNAWRGTDQRIAQAHPYVFQKYPTILYRNGERRKVTNVEDHDLHLSMGWKETP